MVVEPKPATPPDNPRFAVPGTALNRVLTEAAFYTRCSDNKSAALMRPRHYAIHHPYMQINRPGMVSWLIFDLDHADALIWDRAGLPAPNLVVRNRTNGHSHVYYAIVPVCTSDSAREAPIAYMKAVYEGMAARLQADPEYHGGPVAKTPGHPWWETSEYHDHVYDLGELADEVKLPKPKPWSKGPNLDEKAHSRHCILFERLRFYAYSIVNEERETGTFEQFKLRLEAFAYNNNDFKAWGFVDNLALSSLRATVRSVSRWTWHKYDGSGRCHRGVMQLDPTLPLEERQRLAAVRTHGLRHKATESKVRAVCRFALAKGHSLTITLVARVARLCRQTVAKYSHVLEEVASATTQSIPAVVNLVQAAVAPGDVNYGAHQISATPAPSLSPLPVLPCTDSKPPDP